MTERRLDELPEQCFEGAVPAMLATCSSEGVPNCAWLSHVFRMDAHHVALSCQFFRKTRANLSENPHAQILVVDPRTARQYRLDVQFLRSDASGRLFDTMKKRLEAIAALADAKDVFALRSADVFAVRLVREIEVDTVQQFHFAPSTVDPLTVVASVTECVAACRGLDGLLHDGLECLMLQLGLSNVSLYLADGAERTLHALASRGYPHSGIGARVAYGVGLVGVVAEQLAPIRIADVARELRYSRVVSEQIDRAAGRVEHEVPLPGIHALSSFMAVPLQVDGELFGVLSTESTQRLAYGEVDTTLFQTVGQVLALAVARALERASHGEHAEEIDRAPAHRSSSPTTVSTGVLKVKYYEADDSVFLDGEYLIKGLPGKILWLLLRIREAEGREVFLNRELRRHPDLKLPGYKDNLEARLLMLQRRLEDRTASVQVIREERGRLRLSVDRPAQLECVSV